jgi:cyclophilin family peptidyl-prolyl cis-trans isomerase
MATSKRERQKAARRQKIEAMQRAEKRRKSIRRGVIVTIVALLVVGSGAWLFSGKSSPTTSVVSPQQKANAIAVAAGCPASTATRVNTLSWKTAPAMTINTSKTYYAHVVTTAGTFVIKLDAATAPITTNNFVFLAQHKYYDCVIFHRVIPNFMDQTGDPTGLGTGGPGYTIADELPKVGHPTYPLYSVAMANTGHPHTGGSQFFIVAGPAGEALGNTYSLFGQVVSGQSVVKAINDAGSTSGVPPTVTHRMITVTITES